MVIKAAGTEDNIENLEIEVEEEEVTPPIVGDETPPELAEETEIQVAIGAEPSPNPADEEEDVEAPIDGQPAPQYVKDLRTKAKEDRKKIRQLEADAEQARAEAAAARGEAPAVAMTIVGEEPTMESCDYDADKFKADFRAWMERKAAADRETEDAKRKLDEDKAAEQTRLASYNEAAAKLGAKDFAQCQDRVVAGMSKMQQSILLALKNPALVVLALGRSPTALKELAAEKDPVKFAVAAAYVEKDIKVKQVPKFKGEAKLPGSSGAAATAANSTLTKLQEEADRTGDRTKVVAHMRAQQKAAKKK